MKAKFFSVYFVSGVILCFVFLFFSVNHVITRESNAAVSCLVDCKAVLLESIPGNKVIVHGGSNARFGIDPYILEEYFGRAVINLGQHAGIPLEHKLYQIQKHSVPGDIVILSLEWQYYQEQPNTLPSDYVQRMLDGIFHYYYDSMPLFNRIRFIVSEIPVSEYRNLLYRMSKSGAVSKDVGRYAIKFMNNLNKKRGGRGEVNAEDNNIKRKEVKNKCDTNILHSQMIHGWNISEVFKNNIKLIKGIQGKGVTFIFTWPTVVGDDCYGSRESLPLQEYVDKIRGYLSKNGFMVLGSPQDSNFPSTYILDTHYHVTLDGMEIRTRKLLELIKENGIRPFNEKVDSREIDEFIKSHLANNMIIYEHEKLNSWDKQKLDASKFSEYGLLREGWYPIEKWGVWSQLDKSSLVFKLPKGHKGSIDLHFKGLYFNGEENTAVYVKGRKLAEQPLTDAVVHIPEELFEDRLVTVELHHKNPVSPLELGQSADWRKIKYGLVSLAWSSTPGSGN